MRLILRKWMRLIHSEDEVVEAYNTARSESMSSFGDDTVYLQKIVLSEDTEVLDEVVVIGYGAKTELQKLRNARNAKEALIANSPAELEDVIVNDARREFMCEGQLFYFYKRLGRKVVDESGNYTMTEKDFVLPLPDVELEFGNRLSELYK